MKNKLIEAIGYLMLIYSILLFISSIIYSFSSDISDKWFSRLNLSIICLGFGAVILSLTKNKNI